MELQLHTLGIGTLVAEPWQAAESGRSISQPTASVSVSVPATEAVARIGSAVLHVLIALMRRSGRRVVLPAGAEIAAN